MLRDAWKRQKKAVETVPMSEAPSNREERRRFRNSMKRKGAGWTRPFREGREQRHPFITTTTDHEESVGK